MTTSILLLLSAMLPGTDAGLDQSYFDQALNNPEGMVVRGQSPEINAGVPLTVPPTGIQSYYPPGDPFATQGPIDSQVFQGYPAPVNQDPWLGGGGMQPLAIPAPGYGYGYGSMNAQPHRFGWQDKHDIFFAPGQTASGGGVTGDVEILGVDIEKIWTTPAGYGWIFSMAPQFNYRSMSGPGSATATSLPGSFYRFGLDLELQTPNVAGWTFELGFTPGLATDFNGTLDSDALQFDGRIVAFWQVAPQFTIALGAAYWDRLDSKIVPYAGVIWNPNPLWEFRLVLPKPRVSVFLGTPWGVPTWMYVEGEYHVESFQYQPPGVADSIQTQFEDYRVVGGLRWETGYVTTFAEAGYIFDRNVEFEAPGTGFGIDSGFIGRLGIRF